MHARRLVGLSVRRRLAIARRWRPFSARVFGREIFVIDQLSAPLLPLVALLYFLTNATTLRTKIRHDSFAPTLISEAMTLAIFSCQLALAADRPARPGDDSAVSRTPARGRSTRIYVLHMVLFVGLLIMGRASSGLKRTVKSIPCGPSSRSWPRFWSAAASSRFTAG